MMHQNGVSNQGGTLYQGGSVSHSSGGDNASDELVQNHHNLLHKLKDIQFNWFEFVDSFCCHIESSKLHMYYDHFFSLMIKIKGKRHCFKNHIRHLYMTRSSVNPFLSEKHWRLVVRWFLIQKKTMMNNIDINDPRVKALYLRYHSSIQRHARYL